MPRKPKIGTEIAHVTRDSDTTFKVKRSRSPGRELHLSVRLSICHSVSLSVFLSIYHSASLSFCPLVCLSVCLSVALSVHLLLRLTQSIHLFIPSVHLMSIRAAAAAADDNAHYHAVYLIVLCQIHSE